MTNSPSVFDFYNCGVYVGSTVAVTDGMCVVKAKVTRIDFQRTEFREDNCTIARITLEGRNPLHGDVTQYELTAWPNRASDYPEHNLSVHGLLVIAS